ncbi:MAG: nuclear transport factor 2 family protein [Deltaproteobacteria bacterium]|nr:nuclear transport factor 2 family protein [Deltaproteobacteria bacterium]
MKSRIVYAPSIVFVLVMSIMLTWGSGLVLAGQDDVAIDKVRLDFNAAFNQGNAKAMDQLIDPNAIWLPPGEPSIAGKDKILARYTNIFAGVRSKFELKPGEIQVCGGWAFVSGDYTRVDTPKAGGTFKQVSGHYLFVLKKQPDGTWKITRDIWNETVKP